MIEHIKPVFGAAGFLVRPVFWWGPAPKKKGGRLRGGRTRVCTTQGTE